MEGNRGASNSRIFQYARSRSQNANFKPVSHDQGVWDGSLPFCVEHSSIKFAIPITPQVLRCDNMNTSLDLMDPHYFLLSNGERVAYTHMEGEDNSAGIDITGKRVNWITEYYSMIEKSFPNVVRELDGNEGVVDSSSETVGGSSASCLRLRGSTRTGLYVLADEGRPPPTREERDPLYIDLTTCRQFMLENGDRVLYTGGDSNMKRFHERSDFIGKSVDLSPIGGAERVQVRIARELQDQEKSTVLSKHGPTECDSTFPYILKGAPTSFMYTIRHNNIDGLDRARARSIAAERAEQERFYATAGKRVDTMTCREFLLSNGERVIYVPETATIERGHKTKPFDGLVIHWNPDNDTLGQKKAFIVREVETEERSKAISPNGPSDDMPTAPHVLTGTIKGGLYTLPPRVPAQDPTRATPDVPPHSPLGHANIGRLFPVVSVTDISTEFQDRLLQSNMDYDSDLSSYLVLVDSLTERYEHASSPGGGMSNTSSPFQNQDPHACASLLRQSRQQTGSDLNFEYFIILDSRSLEDVAVLMVEAIRADEDDDAGDAAAGGESYPQALRVLTLRAEMAMVNARFLYYTVEGTMREDIEELEDAASGDGVLRDRQWEGARDS